MTITKIATKLRHSMRRQLQVGWRVAFEAPTPAWKSRGMSSAPGIWFDLTVVILCALFGLLYVL